MKYSVKDTVSSIHRKSGKRILTEDESKDKPTRIVDSSCWWDKGRTVENNWDIDISQSSLWSPDLVEPEWNWQECTDDESIQVTMVEQVQLRTQRWIGLGNHLSHYIHLLNPPITI